MKLHCIVLTLTACVVAIGCTSAQPKLQELSSPPERISQKGYSFVPPNEKAWVVIGRSQTRIALAKHGENPDESYAVQGNVVEIGPYETQAEFVQAVKDAEAQDTPSQRFHMSQHEVVSVEKHEAACARSHAVVEDNAAQRKSGSTGPMVLEYLALTCPYPKDKHLAVSVNYSQRYYAGDRDPSFDEKAMSVLNTVELQ